MRQWGPERENYSYPEHLEAVAELDEVLNAVLTPSEHSRLQGTAAILGVCRSCQDGNHSHWHGDGSCNNDHCRCPYVPPMREQT